MGNGGKWGAKSKRQSTKMRVKIEKKVKDHAKKLKKEKRKNPGKFRKSKKDLISFEIYQFLKIFKNQMNFNERH